MGWKVLGVPIVGPCCAIVPYPVDPSSTYLRWNPAKLGRGLFESAKKFVSGEGI